MQIIGLFLLWFGVVFCVLGVVGMVRMPDVYARLHATGKVSTVGLFGILLGAAILMPSLTLKVMAMLLFLLFTMPTSSHAIAMAAYRRGVPMKNRVRDDLARARQKPE